MSLFAGPSLMLLGVSWDSFCTHAFAAPSNCPPPADFTDYSHAALGAVTGANVDVQAGDAPTKRRAGAAAA